MFPPRNITILTRNGLSSKKAKKLFWEFFCFNMHLRLTSVTGSWEKNRPLR